MEGRVLAFWGKEMRRWQNLILLFLNFSGYSAIPIDHRPIHPQIRSVQCSADLLVIFYCIYSLDREWFTLNYHTLHQASAYTQSEIHIYTFSWFKLWILCWECVVSFTDVTKLYITMITSHFEFICGFVQLHCSINVVGLFRRFTFVPSQPTGWICVSINPFPGSVLAVPNPKCVHSFKLWC